jgi:ABC-type multidrug transport system fused ATPase/permease subunit
MERPTALSIPDFIFAFVGRNKGLVSVYVIALFLAVVFMLVGVTKATSTLYQAVSDNDRRTGMISLAVIFGVSVVAAVANYVAEYVENILTPKFRHYVLNSVVRRCVDANRHSFMNVTPMRYRAFVQASARSSVCVFNAVVQSYIPNIVLTLVIGVFLFVLDWRYGLLFLGGLGIVAALFWANKKSVVAASVEAERKTRAADFFVFDIIQCLSTVMSKGMADQELRDVETAVAEARDIQTSMTQKLWNLNFACNAVIVVVVFGIMLLAVRKTGHASKSQINHIIMALTLMATLHVRMTALNATNLATVKELGCFVANDLGDDTARPTLDGLLSVCDGDRGDDKDGGKDGDRGDDKDGDRGDDKDGDKDGDKGDDKDGDRGDDKDGDKGDEGGGDKGGDKGGGGGEGAAHETCPVTVVFDRVSFGYPGKDNPTIIRDFSWTVAPGISVLRSGSGTGKSTLAKLLVRLFDPVQGRILLNGKDLRDLRLADLRRTVAFTNQDLRILDRTLREALLYGTGATDAELQAVWAGMRDLFEDMTLNSKVGKSAGRLSTGMKQMLRLGNLQLSAMSVVVVDEPASGLDALHKARVLETLQKMGAAGKTLLLITHDDETTAIGSNVRQLQEPDDR